MECKYCNKEMVWVTCHDSWNYYVCKDGCGADVTVYRDGEREWEK